MPDVRGLGERAVESALTALASALGTAGVGWMIIGGIAAIARGVRRMTTDIDAVVTGSEVGVNTLIATLEAAQIVPRIERAAEFAQENLVLLLRHRPSGVDLDVSLAWTEFELEAIEARTPARYGNVEVPMARAEDLVIYKAMAGRPKDVDDASTLLLLHRGVDLVRVRRHVHTLAMLADEPDLEKGFEAILSRVEAMKNR